MWVVWIFNGWFIWICGFRIQIRSSSVCWSVSSHYWLWFLERTCISHIEKVYSMHYRQRLLHNNRYYNQNVPLLLQLSTLLFLSIMKYIFPYARSSSKTPFLLSKTHLSFIPILTLPGSSLFYKYCIQSPNWWWGKIWEVIGD